MCDTAYAVVRRKISGVWYATKAMEENIGAMLDISSTNAHEDVATKSASKGFPTTVITITRWWENAIK